MLSNIREVQARGAVAIVIAEQADDTVRPLADHLFEIPSVSTLPAVAVDDPSAGVRRIARAGPRGYDRQATQPGQSVTVE